MDFYTEKNSHTLAEYDVEFFKMESDTVRILTSAHIHSALEILYFTEGEFKVDVGGTQSFVRPGDMVLISSNTVHSVYHLEDNPGGYYVLKLSTEFLRQALKGGDGARCMIPFLRSKKEDKCIFKASELSGDISLTLRKMISECVRGGKTMLPMEKAYACILVISIFRDFFVESESDGRDLSISRDMIALIHESIRYVNSNYASDITPAECARRANLSYSYYAKIFRAVVGKSFKEYLTGLRLAKAHNILLSCDFPVIDVAFSCGYKSPAYFTAEYKRLYGVTPSETRRSTKRSET